MLPDNEPENLQIEPGPSSEPEEPGPFVVEIVAEERPQTSKDTRAVSRLSVVQIRRVRDSWGSNAEYVVSTIAIAVGLGNLYRFPYICQQNGGGAFIFPYLFTAIFIGFPYLLMEAIMGQYFQASILTIWRICPLMKGIGILNFLVVFWTCGYYIIILSWMAYYLCASFSISDLPWETCNHSWNTPNCISIHNKNFSETSSSVYEFFYYGVLNSSDHIFNIGHPQWLLLTVLAALWMICYLCLFRGIKSLGRIITIMLVIPIITIAILVVRSLQLPGALSGIAFLFSPNFTKITYAQVWYQAASQVFFSYSVGFGAIITYNSYNDYHTNVWRASLIVATCDTLICIVCAIMVYSILGFIALELNKSMDDLARKGPALVFLVYPTALSLLPVSPLWSVLFFLGTLVLGLTSVLGFAQSLICALEDENDFYVHYRWLITLLICCVLFLIGILLTTRAGRYYVDFLDSYGGAGWAVIALVLFEGIMMSYLYGADKMMANARDMIGYGLPRIMKYLWLYISPFTLFGILCFSFFELKFLSKEPGFVWWIDYFGIFFAFSSIIWVPIYAVYRLLREKGSFKQRYKKAATPQEEIRRKKRSDRISSVKLRSNPKIPSTDNSKKD